MKNSIEQHKNSGRWVQEVQYLNNKSSKGDTKEKGGSHQECACDAGHLGSIPGSGRSPGEGNSNPLQYSCLENPTNREAWEAIVHGVTKSWTGLKRLNTHTLWSSLVASFPWWFFFIASLVAQMVKNLSEIQETQVQSLGQEDLLEKGIATYSSIFAWRIPRTEKPGGL